MNVTGNKMPKSRINIVLPEETTRRLDAYCVEIAKIQKKLPHGLKQAIGRAAIREWLDRHEKDFDVEKLLGPLTYQ